MKKVTSFLSIVLLGLSISRPCFSEDITQDIQSRVNRIHNLFVEFKILRRVTLDLDASVKAIITGKTIGDFKNWDLMVRNVREAQNNPQLTPLEKFKVLFSLNEMRWLDSYELSMLSSRELKLIGDRVRKELDEHPKSNLEYSQEFQPVYLILTYARAVLNLDQDLFDASLEHEDFEKLKQSAIRSIDLFERVVQTYSELIGRWNFIRENKKERKKAQEDYEKAKKEYELESRRNSVYMTNKKVELFKKYGMNDWAIGAVAINEREARALMKKDNDFEKKYT